MFQMELKKANKNKNQETDGFAETDTAVSVSRYANYVPVTAFRW